MKCCNMGLYWLKTGPNMDVLNRAVQKSLEYCVNIDCFSTTVFSYTHKHTFPFSFSSLPAHPQINNGNYGKSPYLTQSFPEEHWLMFFVYFCVFSCVSQWVRVSDIYVFVYVFGTWAHYLVEWWWRPVVYVRLMMCDMHTIFIYLFILFYFYFASEVEIFTSHLKSYRG